MIISIKKILLLGLLAFCCSGMVWGQKMKKNHTEKLQAKDLSIDSIGRTIAVGNDSASEYFTNDNPFLTGYFYSTRKIELNSFQERVNSMAFRKAVQYYQEDGSMPRTFSFPRFPPNIYLALFFRNNPPAHSGNGAIFEYKIVDVANKGGDTSIPWSKSKSVILLTNLESNTNYMLMVRYMGEGNKISAYFFKTQAAWEPYWQYAKKKLPYLMVIFLIVNAFLLWRFLNTKRRNRQYQLELKSLFAQLNPHFLFNSLSSIQGLINSDEIEKANQYLSGFSGLLRTTLDKGGKEVIPLSEELENLENYIHFEQLRFNFQYEKDIEPDLPLTEINMLPLLAQPLIENSVKHGISGMGEKGILCIRLYRVERDLLMAVKDNGKGFDVEDYKAGYGVDLVQKRIAAYNKWHRKTKIHLTMKSAPGNTVIVLQFENWLPK